MKKIIVTSLLLFVLVSCKSKATMVAEDIKQTETSTIMSAEMSMAEMISRGESLFSNKCGNCHALPKVKDHTPENWKPIMIRMQKAAELSDKEREYVYNYIVMQ